MLLPRELIYKDRETLDELAKNSFTDNAIEALQNYELITTVCEPNTRFETEEQYVEILNISFYLLAESMHRSRARMRINEYKDYILKQAELYNIIPPTCVDVVFTIMYYAASEVLHLEETFYDSLRLQITDEYFFNMLWQGPFTHSSLAFPNTEDIVPAPQLTEDYLTNLYWPDITKDGNSLMIKHILKYVAKCHDERKRIAEVAYYSMKRKYDTFHEDFELDCFEYDLRSIYKSIVGVDDLNIPNNENLLYGTNTKVGDDLEHLPSNIESFCSPFAIVKGKQTSVLVVLETMYKAKWIRKADGSKYHSRDEMINDVMRVLFNQEEAKNVKQKLNSAKNRTYEGKKKYIDELMKHITENEQVIKV